MLSLTVLFTSALVGVAVAQNSTSLGPIPSFVDLSEENQWCRAQFDSCPFLCGGQVFLKTNYCLGSDLTNYICACTNGSSPPPDIARYINTVPNKVCNAQFQQCRSDNPGSTACKVCDTLDPTNIPKGVVSTTATSSTQATSTSISTSTAAPAATNVHANGAMSGRRDFSAVIGVLAALGLFL